MTTACRGCRGGRRERRFVHSRSVRTFFFSRARSARAFAAKERVQENRPHGR